MIPADNMKDAIEEGQKNLAKLAQGQNLEKGSKLTGTSYLMPYPTGKENERTMGVVEKSKMRMKRREERAAHKRPLTKREAEIVCLIADGLRNKDVAKALGISVKTVETHRVNIMNKLALQNLAQLIRYAVQNRLIHIEVDK